MWWEWFPGLGFGKGPRTGEGTCPCPLSPVPILEPDGAHTVSGFAAAEVAGAAQPRQVGRGGGSAVTDAM